MQMPPLEDYFQYKQVETIKVTTLRTLWVTFGPFNGILLKGVLGFRGPVAVDSFFVVNL